MVHIICPSQVVFASFVSGRESTLAVLKGAEIGARGGAGSRGVGGGAIQRGRSAGPMMNLRLRQGTYRECSAQFVIGVLVLQPGAQDRWKSRSGPVDVGVHSDSDAGW